MEKKYYIDLFAGCGGLSLGLHNAGWTGLFAVEKNEDAFSTLSENLINKKSHFKWPDFLKKSNLDIYNLISEYKNDLQNLKGKVQLVVGGPPCQGFSMAGKRIGTDERNKLVDAYIKFVELVSPELVFLENVQGFTISFGENHKKGEPYSSIVMRKLKRLGYHIQTKVIDVSEFGIPQRRKRFILIGSKSSQEHDFFQELYNQRENFLNQKGINQRISIEDAIGDLLKENGTYMESKMPKFLFGNYGKINSRYQKLMRCNDVGKPDSHRFANHNENTTLIFEQLIKRTTKMMRVTPKMNIVSGFKKRGVTVLKSDQISTTVTSIPDDFIHYREPRILTVREMARIQSFPDWYTFLGKYTTGGQLRKVDVPRYTQVANAVPPLFAEQVGIILKNMLK